ncbi:MAG TPA: cytochrome c-type biogenesis protein [Longimicrobiales bacterium]
MSRIGALVALAALLASAPAAAGVALAAPPSALPAASAPAAPARSATAARAAPSALVAWPATVPASTARLAHAAARQEAAPAAADSVLEARTRAVASQLRCPVCQGMSIEDSPTELARDMRAVVREQLASGRSPEEVKAYFVSKYGEWILLEPEPHGLNLAVYLLPVLALAVGTGVVVRSVRRWTRAAATEPPES